jgi:thiol-disulfide isomerase/thioredoxin
MCAPLATAQAAEALPLTGPMAKLKLSAPDAASRAPVPDVVSLDETGAERRLSEHLGKLVLLNFWATWCIPCVKEMPALLKLSQRWQAEGRAATVLPISLDRAGLAKVQEFYAQHGLASLPLRNDKGGAAGRAFSLRGLPTSILIDAKGREIGRFEGDAPWDGPEAEALFKALLSET